MQPIIPLSSAFLSLMLLAHSATAQSAMYDSALEADLLQKYGHQRCQCKYRSELSLLRNPELRAKRAAFMEASERWIAENEALLAQNRAAAALVTIPVVVHVVYKAAAGNISNAQILSQIDILNEDFRKLNSDFNTNVPAVFQSLGADAEIEFCLATLDPQGNSTTGITRKSTSITNIGGTEKVCYTAQGGQDAWDTDKYLNIWVADIDNDGTLGYAYLPSSSPVPAEDGLVIIPSYFGDTGTAQGLKGRTATHEIGHWFNLEHIWGDEPNCSVDDGVSDTPLQGGEYYNCPTHPQTSCGSNDMFMNYMDYTDDNCMGIFTTGQKTRMQSAINTYRSGLFSATGCNGGASGINSVARDLHLSVSPNPATDLLRVVINTDGVYTASLRLIDMVGHTVLIQNIEKYNYLDVSALPAGVYTLQVAQDDRTYTQKVIIH